MIFIFSTFFNHFQFVFSFFVYATSKPFFFFFNFVSFFPFQLLFLNNYFSVFFCFLKTFLIYFFFKSKFFLFFIIKNVLVVDLTSKHHLQQLRHCCDDLITFFLPHQHRRQIHQHSQDETD